MDRCHIIIGFRDGLALGENSPDDSQDKNRIINDDVRIPPCKGLACP